ncbi:MAG: UbiA family prenyltransferase [Tepidisphaeraceae bacterium]|jgi:4-hydroxybenzoate polyprenyltransferase
MLRLGRRLLPILQLTRMALVFTALADSGCALLLYSQQQHIPWWTIAPHRALALALVSIGLYGFGMSLNDIIDHRRDMRLASHRPLPSGRIGVAAAHAVCVLLAVMAFAGALVYSALAPAGHLSLVIFGFTLALILFYDLAGKYLVAPGLLTLGLIRFFHAAFPAPQLPVPWHPLLLLNHVAIVSTIAYHWEQKRPPLTKRHWCTVLGGLAGIDLLVIMAFAWRRHGAAALSVEPGLILPAAAVAGFIALAIWTHIKNRNSRQAGQTLMLRGLLWLIVYDAAFVAGYVGLVPAALLLTLLPIAYLCVQLMRWWNQFLALSQRPAFKRVET